MNIFISKRLFEYIIYSLTGMHISYFVLKYAIIGKDERALGGSSHKTVYDGFIFHSYNECYGRTSRKVLLNAYSEMEHEN